MRASSTFSRDHLVKVLRRLAAGGYMLTTRGAGGGVKLAKEASVIRLSEVFDWLEDESALAECFRDDGGHCLLPRFCALRLRLERARRAFYAELDSASLADGLNPALREFVGQP
ncbi:RrF2 family transcriptional regulator [Acidihalobacter yilgarnensis]|uniref:RrF2 family transcriptional regulator n=1 Tax=Acidihalobacter yilgarnensis TaxID=2819280 RepID=UPI0018D4D782|nr:Rrf2 family transcriptional regulator [Acidihalobacter yilgarnensis]